MDFDIGTRNKHLRLGTWNVRTLATAGASEVLSSELEKYRMDIVALQEVRWPYDGKEATKGYQIYYSGNQEGHYRRGVGVAVRRQLDESVLSFEARSERLCILRIKGRFKNISLVSFYAPTEDAEDEVKDDFYDELENVWMRLPNYDIKLLLGDANGKIGRESVWEKVAGKESLHEISSDSGTRLLTMALACNMKVVSTMFPRKRIHKETWISPTGTTKNQIDHVLIDTRHKRNIKNVRSIRGAECGSDHNLVLIEIYQRIAVERREKTRQKPQTDWIKLRDPVVAANFRTKMRNGLEEKKQGAESQDIENKWNIFKTTLQECAKDLCGNRVKEKAKPWLDQECEDFIIKRREARAKWLKANRDENREEYNDINRKTTRLLRQKKRNWLKSLVEKAEEDRTNNNARDFYRTTRFFRKEYKPKPYGVNNKDGNIITQPKEGLDRWKEYFEDLLNVTEANEEQRVKPKYQHVQPALEKPRLEDVKQAIKEMKNNKAPGEDGINAEMIKIGGDVTAKEILDLVLDIWEQKTTPKEWTEAIIIPIHKKGDKQECNNYRGISLLNCTYKILSKIILKRLEDYTQSIFEEHQSGFVKGKSTTDQIFIVKETIAKYWEYNRECYLLFIDFSKAYDSLKRDEVWYKLESFGIPEELIELVKMTTEQSKCKVKINGELSESFNIKTGVRQGDGLSPTLFNIALEEALQKVNKANGGINIGKKINVLAFADDVVVISESLEDLIGLAQILIKETLEVGLKVNDDKTKFMHVKRFRSNTIDQLAVNNHKFQRVDTFKYLGVTLSENSEEDVEIQSRLNAANRSYHACMKLMKSRLLSRHSKITIYRTIIRPVLIYGAENWIMTKKTEKKIVTFENKILRQIFGPIQENGEWRIRHNEEIRDLYNLPDVVAEVRSARLRWIGHIIRRDDNANIKHVWGNKPEGSRPRGRPKKRWWDEVRADMRKASVTEEDATDRTGWRQKCGEAKYRLGYKWPWE